MAGVDYVVDTGLDAAVAAWRAAVEPYRRSARPSGDAARSALLILDLQRFFCDPESHAHLPAVHHLAQRVRGLANAYRLVGAPVIYTRHALGSGEDPGRMGDWWGDVVREGHPWSELWDAAGAMPVDRVLRKTRYDAFADTPLGDWLDGAGVTTVVLAGVMTHLCVETTARAAFARDLHVLVAADGTASLDEALHVGALRALAHGFAQIRTCDDLIAWRRAAEPGRSPTLDERSPFADLAVIGAGPAGLAAAVQAIRQGLSVALFEAARPGGLLHQADLVENYLGAGWLRGTELATRLVRQAARSGVRPIPARVQRLSLEAGGGYRLDLAGRGSMNARAVVLATGTRPRAAELPGAAELRGSLVFEGVRELLADGPDEPGRAVVIGGGDIAFDGAVSLRRRGWTVDVLVRGAAPRALGLLSRRLEELGVRVQLRSRVDHIAGADRALRLTGSRDGAPASWGADRVLIAVGRVPCLPEIVDHRGGGLGRSLVSLDEVDTLPRLVVAGDVGRGRDRQAAIAAGDGVAAAMVLARELEETPG